MRPPRSHIVFAILFAAGVLAVAAFVVSLPGVWLLGFGGVLLAVALRGAGEALAERMPGTATAWTGFAAFCLFGLAVLGLILLGPAMVDGLAQLRELLPQALDRARSFVQDRPELDELLRRTVDGSSLGEVTRRLLGRFGDVVTTAADMFSLVSGALVGLLVICIVGIYGALAPERYVDALLPVFPESRRPPLRELASRLAGALRWWLIGRMASMAVVGLLSWVGLIALGVPAAGTLAMLAAVLSFVPNVGPVLAAIPALLVGLGEGGSTALYVLALYLGVQTVESYAVTPLIQQRVVALPPAAVIVAQLAFGAALGVLGLLFATPLAVVAMVLIQALWIEGRLRRDAEADAEASATA